MSRSHSFFILLSICILSSVILTYILSERSTVSALKKDIWVSDDFREQDLSPDLYDSLTTNTVFSPDWTGVLTTTMLTGNFHPHKIYQDSHLYLKYKKYEFLLLKKAYRAVWNDLRFFPVADSAVFFEDSWMESRSYGGSRHHEGTDLFGQNTISGYYPIISMTDGIVEQKGWLPLGGYRIGIRADSGGYFYYAHLASYEKEFSPGDTVHAGDILGFMGNTGYGKEGTSGKFPVHLHLGIYISVPGTEELSVNPYHILLAVRKNIRKYTYY